jgi:hypothetical protein
VIESTLDQLPSLQRYVFRHIILEALA